MMYTPLTTHSAYSLQEGLALLAELVQAARACGAVQANLFWRNICRVRYLN